MKRITLLLSLSLLLLSAACSALPQATALPTEPIVVPPLPVTEQPAATQPGAESQDEEAFVQALAQAVASRDLDTLRKSMKDRFSFELDAFELRDVPAEEALQWLSGHQLAEGAQPVPQFESDVPALLKGADPLGMWGPVAHVVRALHITGLGASAQDEAVIVIGQDESGQFYWHGIVIPNTGNFEAYGTLLIESYETNVMFALTKSDVALRTGPGEEYELLDTIPAGKTTQVIGISADNLWYRTQCTGFIASQCWISADPTLTEPTDG
jgi:hypothetical protein